jgi:hypothetical protein
MKDAAERFGVAYGTLRNWAHEFRAAQHRGESPPFFCRPLEDVQRMRPRPNALRKNRPWPTRSRCRWKWNVA